MSLKQPTRPPRLPRSFFTRLKTYIRTIRKDIVRSYYRQKISRVLELETISCPLCGNQSAFTLIQPRDRYGISVETKRCNSCGLLMEQPAPTEKFLNNFYSSRAYYGLYEGILHGSRNENADAERKTETHLRFVEDTVNLSNLTSILDFGSGYGGFLLGCKKKNSDLKIYGIEPGVEFRKENEQQFDEIFENVSRIPKELRFDLITFFHVLEHLKDPVSVLQTLRDHLSTSGKIILEIPDEEQYTGIRSFHIAHLYHFNKKTIALLAEKSGLKVTIISLHDRIDPQGMNVVLEKT